tara:strand:+ start:531 stop:968 length:438 start_codon:yes stop_codon:yes gene_type:complete
MTGFLKLVSGPAAGSRAESQVQPVNISRLCNDSCNRAARAHILLPFNASLKQSVSKPRSQSSRSTFGRLPSNTGITKTVSVPVIAACDTKIGAAVGEKRILAEKLENFTPPSDRSEKLFELVCRFRPNPRKIGDSEVLHLRESAL